MVTPEEAKLFLTPLHPSFRTAVRADARQFWRYRGEKEPSGRARTLIDIVRLCVVTDAFLALLCYRARMSLRSRKVPLVPFVLHRMAIVFGQVSVGDLVQVDPGLYLPHGQIVIAGATRIGSNVAIRPFVTIGLREGNPIGPKIASGALIGTGAKVIGPVQVGSGAWIGANAVVMTDVPDGAVAVGVPAVVKVDSSRAGASRPASVGPVRDEL